MRDASLQIIAGQNLGSTPYEPKHANVGGQPVRAGLRPLLCTSGQLCKFGLDFCVVSRYTTHNNNTVSTQRPRAPLHHRQCKRRFRRFGQTAESPLGTLGIGQGPASDEFAGLQTASFGW